MMGIRMPAALDIKSSPANIMFYLISYDILCVVCNPPTTFGGCSSDMGEKTHNLTTIDIKIVAQRKSFGKPLQGRRGLNTGKCTING